MEGSGQEQSIVGLWDPSQTIRRVNPREVDYSRGFLRCQLEQWFPGLGIQWLTLTQTLGIEVKITGVEPKVTIPSGLSLCFSGRANQEEIAIAGDRSSLANLAEACVPGANEIAREIVLEYLARRFLSSILLAWGGPQGADFVFSGVKSASDISAAGAVVLKLNINGAPCSITLLLGPNIVDHLDGLWRRQLRSSVGAMKSPGEVHIEIAQLAVKPSAILDYTKSGTVVDLEVPMSDAVCLRFPEAGVLSAKLRSLDQELVLETVAGSPANSVLPEGTTRLSIQLGVARIESSFELAELMQPGAMIRTGLPVSNNALLVVNQERIAQAKICSYEGRFAISVG